MQIKDLIPWNRREGGLAQRRNEDNPVLALQREMNRVFDRFFDRFLDDRFAAPRGGFAVAAPTVDVADTDEAIEVSAELPGLNEKDIEVSVSDGFLSISGEKKAEHEEKTKGYHVCERSYGRFSRTIPLPPGIKGDEAKAEFKNGVLSVVLPKSPEARAKARRIEVKAA